MIAQPISLMTRLCLNRPPDPEAPLAASLHCVALGYAFKLIEKPRYCLRIKRIRNDSIHVHSTAQQAGI